MCIRDRVTDSMLTGKPVVLQNILIQMSGMIIVGTVAAYFADLSRKYYSSLVQREVRGRLAEHLLHLPYSYFDEKGSGSILTRFSSDIGEAGNFFSDILPDLLVDIVTVGTITAYFIQMDVRPVSYTHLDVYKRQIVIFSVYYFLYVFS